MIGFVISGQTDLTMNRLLLLFIATLVSTYSFSQTVIFEDDFESGTSQWSLTGQWGTTTSQAFSGSNSLTDSPSGDYLNNQTTYATMVDSVNLSTALDADVHMRIKFDIENGFDYCYMEFSTNGGSSWTTAYTFNGENQLTNWLSFTQNIGGFCGNSNVKMRFRFYTDAGYQADGIYIDSLRIVSDTVDNAPPLIIHDPDPHYEGQIDTNFRTVLIQDISGVASATLYYEVDGNSALTLSPYYQSNDTFLFAFPALDPGAWVEYWVIATDSSPQNNSATSDTYSYIAGNYIKHDNGVVNFITSFSSTGFYTGVANRITLSGMATLTTALIRNYTDINNPNDSIEVHIWDDNNGNPGSDLIDPIMVFPEPTLLTPQAMTRIDLRPYEDDLDSLTGNIFIGFEVPSGTTWITQTTGSNGRGRNYNGSAWSAATYTYHFRAITGESETSPNAFFVYDSSADPEVTFTDSSANNPSAWSWDFGDGNSDTVQHPTHQYSNPGIYNVCLTATNFVGSANYCEYVTISNAAPIAAFTANTSGDPVVEFTDYSIYNPTDWVWQFGDGGTDTAQNPTYTYADSGTYNVCLIASNSYGSDTACQEITLFNYLPIPLYLWDAPFDNNKVYFENLTADGFPLPTEYKWDFDMNGDTSDVFEPNYQYPETGGTFNVCLTAKNSIGTSTPYCQDVDLDDLTIGVSEIDFNGIKLIRNPASDFVEIQIDASIWNDQLNLRILRIDGSLVGIQSVASASGWQLNVQGMESGVYILEISDEKESMARLPLVIK